MGDSPQPASGEAESTRRWTYQPPLDGLRALAVAAVVAYHLDATWASGGFLGVDAFFVLSGFLITSLLLNEWARQRTISFVAFWARRARRLLPALFLVLLAVAAYAAWQAKPVELGRLRGDMFATLFYGANWRLIHSGQSYFDLFSAASPLRHAWSLAIEEQFYLVWPLVTFACLRLARGRRVLLGAVCAVGAVASALVMAHLYNPVDPSRAYYGTDSRAQLLLIGALLAIFLARRRARPLRPARQLARARRAALVTHAFGALGAVYVLWAFARVGDKDAWMYRGGYALFGVAVAALIASVVRPGNTPLRSALSLRPLVWVGRISYGIYLWHWPVIVVASPARTGLDGAPLVVLRLGLTLALATLSFYLVELPIRERRALRGQLRLTVPPAAFLSTAMIVMLATSGAAPLPRYYSSKPTKVIRTGGPRSAAAQALTTAPPRVLLVGDSIATSFFGGLDQVASANGILMSAAAFPGCGVVRGVPAMPDGSPMPGFTNQCEQAIPKLHEETVAQVHPDVVVWLSSWEIIDHIVDGHLLKLGSPDGNQGVAELIAESAQRLQALGARLVILLPAQPTPGGWLPEYGYSDRVARLQVLDQLLAAQASRHPDSTTLIDLGPIVCPPGPPCPEYVDGVRLRPDGSHFSDDGARYVAERVVPQLVQVLHSPPPTTTTTTAPVDSRTAPAVHGQRASRGR